jgi:hypothetical protein
VSLVFARLAAANLRAFKGARGFLDVVVSAIRAKKGPVEA